MTLETAEKLPNAVFEKVTVPETNTETPPASPSQNSGQVLDIGIKAENSQFLNSADTATVRPALTNGAPSQGWQPTGGTSAKLGDSLSGKTATEILNFLFPAICAYLIDAMGYRFDKRMIELTPDEKKVIASALQDYLNTVVVSFNNPLYTLLFVVGGVYAGKFIEVLPNLQKKPTSEKGATQITTARNARVQATTVVESLIEKTSKSRKKGRNEAIRFLLKQGEIVQVGNGVFKLA